MSSFLLPLLNSIWWKKYGPNEVSRSNLRLKMTDSVPGHSDNEKLMLENDGYSRCGDRREMPFF